MTKNKMLIVLVCLSCIILGEKKVKCLEKYEKVIYETTKDKQKSNLLSKPDTISGVFRVNYDKKESTFGVIERAATYCLVINDDEKTGKAVFFNIFKGDLIKEVPVKIERIGTGAYEIKYLNTKRKLKISYYEYDGNKYIFYDDSSPYTNNTWRSHDAALYSPDPSENSVKKLIQQYVLENEAEGDYGGD